MDKILEVTGLKKSYGQVEAVKGIDFYVERGRLFAFLGPNGAGKSTTIDMLCTFLNKDAGRILIDGREVGKEDEKIRQTIGVVFQDHLLDGMLTVKENLYTRGSFYSMPKKDLDAGFHEAVKAVGIEEVLNRRYDRLSGGQKRRVDIARALVHRPKVLFLDEPTTGLDPQTRQSVWEMIRKLQTENNMTVFLTTHYMEEASAADYVVVIDHGCIAAKGTPDELKNKYAFNVLKLYNRDQQKIKMILDHQNINYEVNEETVSVPVESTMDALSLLEQMKPYIESFEVLKGTMDDVFLGITGREIRE